MNIVVSATTPSAFRPVGPCLVQSNSETNGILRACQLIRSQRKNAAGSRSGNCCQRAALCLHLDQFQHLHLSPSTMSSQFEKAVAYVQGLDKEGSGPDATVKLEFYKFYKQATVGDADPAKEPSMFQFVERAKWTAWNGIKGTSKKDAEEKYVKQLIKYLKEKHPNESILKELEG
ncbi:acyl CoA binding protein-domain-containing protein [Suillus cothurnatus]|nr:acyl CoA binding protein-domain-containing protein [Suillus cothurnatus]